MASEAVKIDLGPLYEGTDRIDCIGRFLEVLAVTHLEKLAWNQSSAKNRDLL